MGNVELVENDKCRLCSGALSFRFKLMVLAKYDIGYYECASCGSLQTEYPYWLDEAYVNGSLSRFDTGAGQRSINNFTASYIVSKLYKAKVVYDVGGGDGLLCRLLRDYEINCFVKDKYARSTYAQSYIRHNLTAPDLILGFEVLEHFAKPSLDLDELFGAGAEALLLSTSIYSNADQDWWYLAPESGQHVFFYSEKALRFIAEKYRYSFVLSGSFILFFRNESNAKSNLIKMLLGSRTMRFIKGWLVTRPAKGVWKDYLTQIEESNNASKQI